MGRSHEAFSGAGVFEVGTSLVPVGALAKAGKLGKLGTLMKAADKVGDATELASDAGKLAKAAKAIDAATDTADAITDAAKVAKAADRIEDTADAVENAAAAARRLDDAPPKSTKKCKDGDGNGGKKNKDATEKASREAAKTVYCFARGTLVTTNYEKREIQDVKPDDIVVSFDLPTGKWVEARVAQTHCNNYSGKIVCLDIGNETIRVTGNHPFWVEKGDNLAARPSAKEQLASIDNRSIDRPGRWVNSQDLRTGDKLHCKNGSTIEITRVELESVKEEPVFNLTVENQHNFAISSHEILVHNEAGFCDVLREKMGKEAYEEMREELAEKFGVDVSRIHAHHIVQKTVPKRYNLKIAGKKVSDYRAPLDSWGKADKTAWYIGKSQEKLTKLKVSILADADDALAAAKRRDPLHNLALAINGEGTHTVATQKAVYDALKNARSRKQAVKALDGLKERFQAGELVGDHGS